MMSHPCIPWHASTNSLHHVARRCGRVIFPPAIHTPPDDIFYFNSSSINVGLCRGTEREGASIEIEKLME